MGWYDHSKPVPMSKEDLAEFTSRYKEPYTADKLLRFHMSKMPRFFSFFTKGYLILFGILILLALIFIGAIYTPLLIIFVGLTVYLLRKHKRNKNTNKLK